MTYSRPNDFRQSRGDFYLQEPNKCRFSRLSVNNLIVRALSLGKCANFLRCSSQINISCGNYWKLDHWDGRNFWLFLDQIMKPNRPSICEKFRKSKTPFGRKSAWGYFSDWKIYFWAKFYANITLTKGNIRRKIALGRAPNICWLDPNPHRSLVCPSILTFVSSKYRNHLLCTKRARAHQTWENHEYLYFTGR